ncbi:hypothetical protein HK102_009123, partial [Quaeritorhiza haematococci]
MKSKAKKPASSSAMAAVDDPRFQRVHTDPRFMRMRKDQMKVNIDDRFKSMLDARSGFHDAAPVDKYGRMVKPSKKNDLKRFYRLDKAEKQKQQRDEEQEEDTEDAKAADEEDVDDEGITKTEQQDKDVDEGEDEDEDEDDEEEEDDDDDEDLQYVAGHDLARGTGLVESSDEEDDDEDELDPIEKEVEELMKIGPYAEVSAPKGDETRRFAAVNMDWDNIKRLLHRPPPHLPTPPIRHKSPSTLQNAPHMGRRRSRPYQNDLANMDFNAYVASASESEGDEDLQAGNAFGGGSDDDEELEEEDEEASVEDAEGDEKKKKGGKAMSSREKYRALLLSGLGSGGTNPTGADDDDDEAPQGDMEVTFTPGLVSNISKALERKKAEKDKKAKGGETVFETYLRERKEKKKARKKGQVNGKQHRGDDEEEDDEGEGESGNGHGLRDDADSNSDMDSFNAASA